jgi:hypothetical protein
VRNGADVRGSSAKFAYKEMLLQCARDYPGLPDARSLTLTEIVFFYSGLRAELRKHTAAKPPQPKPTPGKRRKHGR